ncbi:MAG: hypothetical protein HQ536_02590, partial [Parcubacteria group bacterium]|nr:hypothetical protein [Parcubacteria group bacterium]
KNEWATREWTLSPDISKPKIKKVVLNVGNEDPFTYEQKHADLNILKGAISNSLLRDLRVWNPLRKHIASVFPATEARHQRDIRKILTLIELVTWLHQRQRLIIQVPSGDACAVSTRGDNEIGLEIGCGVLDATLSGVPSYVKEFYEQVMIPQSKKTEIISEEEKDLERSVPITYKNLTQAATAHYLKPISDDSLKRTYLASLVARGWIRVNKDNKPHILEIVGGDLETDIKKFKKQCLNFKITDGVFENFFAKHKLSAEDDVVNAVRNIKNKELVKLALPGKENSYFSYFANFFNTQPTCDIKFCDMFCENESQEAE